MTKLDTLRSLNVHTIFTLPTFNKTFTLTHQSIPITGSSGEGRCLGGVGNRIVDIAVELRLRLSEIAAHAIRKMEDV